MANQYGIDMGEVYRTTEAVKGARTQNKLAELKLSQAQAEPAKQNALAGLRSKAVTGDESAQQELLSLDPKDGPAFLEAISKMDERKAKAVQDTLDEMGSMTATILQAEPERREVLYQEMLKMIPEESRQKMPANYDQNFLTMSLAKQRAMDKVLDTKVLSFGGEDVMVKGGLEAGRADKPVKAGKGGADSGIKSADESLMYRMSTELLGGVFDQAGNITNLDPNARNKAQAIATEATNLFSQNQGKITRAEAVKQAAKKYGLNVNDPIKKVQPTDPADPNNIRSFLLK